MINPPNLRHLRALCAIRATGSISKAAETVFLSQPTVTQAIKNLENSLNEELLIRSGAGVHMSPVGMAYADRASRAIDFIESGISEALRVSETGRGKSAKKIVPLLTTTQLRAFVAVGKTNNFTHAARIINSSQPGVLRVTRALEDVLQTELLEKRHGGIELTRAGQLLWQKVRLAFAEIEQANSEVNAMKGVFNGAIVVGCMPLSRHILLPEAILRFQSFFPSVDIRTIELPYVSLIHGLRHADIDMVLGALRENVEFPDVSQTPLFTSELCIAASTSHPLANQQNIKLTDLSAFPWVVPPQGTPTRSRFETMMSGLTGRFKTGLVETSSQILIRRLLLNSDRLTLISREQVDFEVELGKLVTLAITLEGTSRVIGVTNRSDWKPTEYQSKFLESLRHVAASALIARAR